LWLAVEMLEDEYADDSWIDRNLVIRRLAEIMLVNMSRGAFADRGVGAVDESRMPVNRQLLRAINAFFAAPHRTWTLGEMAREANGRWVETARAGRARTPTQHEAVQ